MKHRHDRFELIHRFAGKFDRPSERLATCASRPPDIFEVVVMRADIAFAARILRPAQIAAFVIVALSLSTAGAAEVVNVTMDLARIVRVPEHTATLVVGNPLVADVSVQTGGTMVVTGKGYGVTNVIALDRAGKVLAEQLVQVKGPLGNVVVYRGTTRESYSCAPNCERRITLGDSPDYFESTLTQTAIRNNRALTGQAPPPGTR
jgi:putative type II/III system pilus formation protein